MGQLQNIRHQIRNLVNSEDEYGDPKFFDFQSVVDDALVGQPGLSVEEQIKRFKAVKRFLKGQEDAELVQARSLAKEGITVLKSRQDEGALPGSDEILTLTKVAENDEVSGGSEDDENEDAGVYPGVTSVKGLFQHLAPAAEVEPLSVVINGVEYFTLEEAHKRLHS